MRPAEPSSSLDRAFHAVSDPLNSTGRFRRYLSHDEIAALVSPQPGAEKALQEWWAAAGAKGHWTRSRHGDVLTMTCTVEHLLRVFPEVPRDAHTYPVALDAQDISPHGAGCDAQIRAPLDVWGWHLQERHGVTGC